VEPEVAEEEGMGRIEPEQQPEEGGEAQEVREGAGAEG